MPLSLMINSATSFLYLTVKLTPPTEVYLTALDSRFIKICLNLFRLYRQVEVSLLLCQR